MLKVCVRICIGTCKCMYRYCTLQLSSKEMFLFISAFVMSACSHVNVLHMYYSIVDSLATSKQHVMSHMIKHRHTKNIYRG